MRCSLARAGGHGTVRPMRELVILVIHLMLALALLPSSRRAVARTAPAPDAIAYANCGIPLYQIPMDARFTLTNGNGVTQPIPVMTTRRLIFRTTSQRASGPSFVLRRSAAFCDDFSGPSLVETRYPSPSVWTGLRCAGECAAP